MPKLRFSVHACFVGACWLSAACGDDTAAGDGGGPAGSSSSATSATTSGDPSSSATSGSAGAGSTTTSGAGGGEGAGDPGSSGSGGATATSGTGGEGGGGACVVAQPVPIEPEACAACTEGRCCAQLADCASGDGCVDLRNCTAGCDGGDCIPGCYEQHFGGVGDSGVLQACTMARCWSECGLPSFASCGPVLTGEDACNVCSRAACCDEAYDVGQIAALYEAAACESLCEDAECEEACLAQYLPRFEDAYGLLVDCQETSCSAECG